MKVLPFAILASVILASCGPKDTGHVDSTAAASSTGAQSGGVDLTGAGSTFSYPIYSKWFSDYAAKTGVKINYQPIGSGGGIRQLSDETVDFGATDAPMTDAQMAKAKGGPIIHIPTVLGAVCVTYNVPKITQPLQLTGEVVADIFLGKITKWNDSRIASINAGVALPAQDILVVHRSDGSGTSFIFTDYLTAVSKEWASGPGKGTAVQWPAGLGGKGNEGVAGQIKQSPGSIGYVELAYAKENNLPVAGIRNASGHYIAPSIDAVTEAAAGAAGKLPPNTDYRISIVNAPGATAYPISSYTWILVYKNQPDSAKGRKMVDFLKWALHDGETRAAPLLYAPLPPVMVARLDSLVTTISVGGVVK